MDRDLRHLISMQNVRCSPVSMPEAKILGMAARGVVPVVRMKLRGQTTIFRDPIHKNGYT